MKATVEIQWKTHICEMSLSRPTNLILWNSGVRIPLFVPFTSTHHIVQFPVHVNVQHKEQVAVLVSSNAISIDLRLCIC